MCKAILLAHILGIASHGLGHVEQVERSSEYHACLVLQCMPASVQPQRSRCTERVLRMGEPDEIRRVR